MAINSLVTNMGRECEVEAENTFRLLVVEKLDVLA